MTRERAKELLPVIQAFAEGKTVQLRNRKFDVQWIESDDPSFDNDATDYRVKPEPRRVWVNRFAAHEGGWGKAYVSRGAAMVAASEEPTCLETAVEFIEATVVEPGACSLHKANL